MTTRPPTERVFRAVKLGDARGVDDVENWCRAGGNPNEVDAKGQKRSRLLHWAAYSGNPQIVAVLLRHGADVNVCESDGKTPLHLAAYEGHAEVVKLLMRCGADYELADNPGKVPVQLAIVSKHWDVAKLFPNYGEYAERGGVAVGDWQFDESMWHTDLKGLDVQRAAAPAAPSRSRAGSAAAASEDDAYQPAAVADPPQGRTPAGSSAEDGLVEGAAVGPRQRRSQPPDPHLDPGVPRLISVVGGARAYPVDGTYQLVEGDTYHGQPLWASGDRRIYSGTNGLWIVTEASVNMSSNSGLITSSMKHCGVMPTQLNAPWETWDPEHRQPGSDQLGSWVLDHVVQITEIRPGESDGGRRRAGSSSTTASSRGQPLRAARQHSDPDPSANGGRSGGAFVAAAKRIEDAEESQRRKEEKHEARRRRDIISYAARDHAEQDADAPTPPGDDRRRRQEKKARKEERARRREAGSAQVEQSPPSASAGASRSAAPPATVETVAEVLDQIRCVLEEEFDSIEEGIDAMGVDLGRRDGVVSVGELRKGLRRVRLRQEAEALSRVVEDTDDLDLRSWAPSRSVRRPATESAASGLSPRRHETAEERERRREERRRQRREERERARQERRQQRRQERDEYRQWRQAERERGGAGSQPGRSPRPSTGRGPSQGRQRAAPAPPRGRSARRARSASRSAASTSRPSYRSAPSPARSLSRQSRGSTADGFRPAWRPPGSQFSSAGKAHGALGFDAYALRLAGWPPRQGPRRAASARRSRGASSARGTYESPPLPQNGTHSSAY
eukprot:TRINITY_DN12428_c0_g1_i2.p1 TRINITY_DN12428_c0_g1~~TRINITY_DN12428_c0_g1_i2.p1  ORF type:complete len:817 (+),score=233.02 TRINITY_DN12428_c0_g1_i2:87-2453(+)